MLKKDVSEEKNAMGQRDMYVHVYDTPSGSASIRTTSRYGSPSIVLSYRTKLACEDIEAVMGIIKDCLGQVAEPSSVNILIIEDDNTKASLDMKELFVIIRALQTNRKETHKIRCTACKVHAIDNVVRFMYDTFMKIYQPQRPFILTDTDSRMEAFVRHPSAHGLE